MCLMFVGNVEKYKEENILIATTTIYIFFKACFSIFHFLEMYNLDVIQQHFEC